MRTMPLLLTQQIHAPFSSAPRRCSRRHVIRSPVCQAAEPQGEGAPKARAAPAAPRRQFTPPADFNPNVKMERMDEMSDDVWEGSGVVQLEELDMEEPSDFQRVLLLVAGDAAALLLFAVIGRLNHSEGLSVAGVWDTAFPFLLGWFATAPFTGAFGVPAQGWEPGKAAGAAAKSWAVGIPAGLVVRSVSRGALPATPFLLVSMAATGVLLVGWRTALAAVTPEPPKMTAYERMIKGHKKMGGPFDFIRFIQSMTRRW